VGQSMVSEKVDRIAAELRDLHALYNSRPKANALADKLGELAEPRGGMELAHVCAECGVFLEDEEVPGLVECPNCCEPFWDLS